MIQNAKACCVCENPNIMFYSQQLEKAWCELHMPKNGDYNMAIQGLKDADELCEA